MLHVNSRVFLRNYNHLVDATFLPNENFGDFNHVKLNHIIIKWMMICIELT